MKKLLLLISVTALALITGCGTDQKANQALTTNTASTGTMQTVPTATSEQANKEIKPADEQTNRISAKVTKVTDGDTLEVKVDGKTEKIRLLLVDTPETKHPNKPVQPYGKEASNFAQETLDGKDVEIELDVSERDKYGRLLAYVWVDNKMFNEMLLEQGLARVAYVYQPNVKYVEEFRKIQDTARSAEKGIWSIENYATDKGFVDTAAKSQQPTSKLKPEPKPEVKSEPVEETVFYKNCSAAREAGAAPLYEGDPGYSLKLDRDKDGVACE